MSMREVTPKAAPLLRRVLRGSTVGSGTGIIPSFDQAFQLGAGAFDVFRQQVVAEDCADVLGP